MKNDLEISTEKYFARQLLLPEVGPLGQKVLSNARVFIAGLGGLGSAAAFYLAAAGIGTLGLLDNDVVEASNLNRQILHTADRIGMPKIQSARMSLLSRFPAVELLPIQTRLTEDNAQDLTHGFDVALGCFDNLASRYALNKACVKNRIANIFGAAARFEGQASVFCSAGAPCYKCFFSEPPLSAPNDQAVIGIAPAVIGSIMATEAIKVILGKGRTLVGRLLLFDGLNMSFREIAIKKRRDCPVCGQET